MGLLATTITIATSVACTTIEANEEERPRGRGPRGRGEAKGRTRGARGEEYCKLLLPLVSCSERRIVCLLPHRTRYCATYLRTHPRQKSSSTSSLSSPSYILLPRLPRRRCRSRPSIAVLLPGCDRSGTSKEVRSIKSEPLEQPLRSEIQAPLTRFRNSPLFSRYSPSSIDSTGKS